MPHRGMSDTIQLVVGTSVLAFGLYYLFKGAELLSLCSNASLECCSHSSYGSQLIEKQATGLGCRCSLCYRRLSSCIRQRCSLRLGEDRLGPADVQ